MVDSAMEASANGRLARVSQIPHASIAANRVRGCSSSCIKSSKLPCNWKFQKPSASRTTKTVVAIHAQFHRRTYCALGGPDSLLIEQLTGISPRSSPQVHCWETSVRDSELHHRWRTLDARMPRDGSVNSEWPSGTEADVPVQSTSSRESARECTLSLWSEAIGFATLSTVLALSGGAAIQPVTGKIADPTRSRTMERLVPIDQSRSPLADPRAAC